MPWFRHRPETLTPEQTADRIRGAIVELTARRDEAARAASAALLGQVEVQHALRDQTRRLGQALAELDTAVALATRVAEDTARTDGELAAAPYRANAEGLESQRQVITAALAQLRQLDTASHTQVGAAREVLVRSRAVFDQALRDQLRLLVAWERHERTRILLAARAGHGRAPGAGGTPSAPAAPSGEGDSS